MPRLYAGDAWSSECEPKKTYASKTLFIDVAVSRDSLMLINCTYSSYCRCHCSAQSVFCLRLSPDAKNTRNGNRVGGHRRLANLTASIAISRDIRSSSSSVNAVCDAAGPWTPMARGKTTRLAATSRESTLRRPGLLKPAPRRSPSSRPGAPTCGGGDRPRGECARGRRRPSPATGRA